MVIEIRKILSALLLTTIFFSACYADERLTYEGFALYRCQPQSSLHVDRLRSMMSEKKNAGIEFWTEPTDSNMPVDIMGSPEEQDYLIDEFKNFRIPCRTMMHDVGEVIRKTSKKVRPFRAEHTYRDGSNVTSRESISKRLLFHQQFQPLAAIESKIKEWAQNPNVRLETAGSSFEGRPIQLVKVSKDFNANKPVILIDAGHHAREWVSHSTLLYMLDDLINGPLSESSQVQARKRSIEDDENELLDDNDMTGVRVAFSNLTRTLRSNLDHYDFWFVPVVNPDGYEYTHKVNRLWRKTRSSHVLCNGVDPNRNYAFHWREAGASKFACDETYAGSKPFSEPETAAVANIMDANKGRITMYITLHAYSQLILVPYGYGRVYPDNYQQLQKVADAGMRAIQSIRGTSYRFGTSAMLLYPAAGGSDDYAHGNSNIKYSYTIELPDRGRHGFLMPPSEIIPIGQETATGIAAMVDAVKVYF